MSVNKVTLVGFVAKDPEVRVVQDAKVATMTLATNEKYKMKSGEVKENTEWHSLVCWRQADFVEKYITKGSMVYIEGKLRTRSWDDQNGVKRYVTEVIVNELQSLDRKRDGQSSPQYGQAQSAQHVDDDDLPEGDGMPF